MLSQSSKYYKDYNDVWWCPFPFLLLLLLPYTLLICVLNMIILYNINKGRSRCYSNTQAKENTGKYHPHTPQTLYNMVSFGFKTKKKAKKKGVRNLTTTCMFSNNTCILYKTNMLKNKHTGAWIYIYIYISDNSGGMSWMKSES